MRSCVPRPEGIRRQGAELLNGLLPNLDAFHRLAHNAHVMTTGMAFAGLHSLFQDTYKMVFEHLDEVKERVRTLGFAPTYDIGAATIGTSVPDNTAPEKLVEMMFAAFETYTAQLDGAYEAANELRLNGLAAVLQNRIADFEKLGWKNVAHVS